MISAFVGKEKNEVTFTMEFTAEEFEAAVQKAYLANRSKITVDGFRKGKAPRAIIERKYGEGIFFEDAINGLLSENYPKALDELKIEPIDQPDIQFGEEKVEKGKGFKVTVKTVVAPEPELKVYKGIEAERPIQSVTDEEVEEEIDVMRKRNARLVDSTEAAKMGDTVVLDYKGFVGEEQFEGGTADGYSLKLGSQSFIPGFEDQLVGVAAGQDKDVVVTFPEEYMEPKLAGKEATFKCTVHEVKTEELPELNDDFAKDVSAFDTFEELKADVKKSLVEKAAKATEYAGKTAVLAKLCELNPVDVPEVMIADEVENMFQENSQQLAAYGLNMKDYCKYLDTTPEKIKEGYINEANTRVQTRLLIDQIAKAEKIEATEEEFQKELDTLAEQYKMKVEELKEKFGEKTMNLIKEDIAYRKAVDFVYNNAVLSEPKEEEPKAEEAAEAKTEE